MSDIAKEGISKGRRNQQQGYNFRGIDEVYNALSPILAKHRLCILPRMLGRSVTERQTQRGGVLFSVTVEAEFDFVCADDGSRHTIRTFGEAMDSADKATNKAMSAAYKYAAMQAFCIPTEGDNDADATHHDVAPTADNKPEGNMPDAEWSKLSQLLQATKTPAKKLLDHYKVQNLRLLNQEQYADALSRLNDTLAKLAKAETDKAAGSPPASEFADIADDDLPY